MLSLRFGLRAMSEETNVITKCLFCRDKNIICSSTWKYKTRENGLQKLDLEGLPECLLLHIFLFLDLKDLMIIRMVSKTWKRIAEDKQLWKTTNLSCKRIAENSWIFLLPRLVKRHIRVLNLMWSSFSIPAFRNLLKSFPNVEVLLLQNCKFSNLGGNGNNTTSKTTTTKVERHLPKNLKLLDLRNIQDRWFDEYNFGFAQFLKIQAVAFSHSLPNNWLSIMSDSSLPNLRILHIQNNPCVTETFMEKIIANSPSLESINVQGCMYINGSFLVYATEKLPLKYLDLNSTRLEGRNLLRAKWNNIELKSLNISFCCKVTSLDLKHLFPKLSKLTHLQCSFVGWGKALSDDVILSVTRDQILQVKCMDLQSTFTMSAHTLTVLCKKCPQLKNLRIGNILKTEHELTNFLDAIPGMEELSLQTGGSTFSAVQLFELIAQKCYKLRSIFLFNILFDINPETKIQDSIENLFVSLTSLENFFVGGYPHREKNRVEGLISKIADKLKLNINFKRPKRIIPQHDGCFDQFLARFISAPYYNAVNLRSALQHTHNCESFYQTGLQKLDNFEFPLVRS